ncbi:MAG: alanine racemase [Ectothiorhodospiraceae bacterium]|nr:alanine racemase [Ectothiorhodospiraceae bacterium]
MIHTVLEDDSIILRPTSVEVDLKAMEHNVRQVRSRSGSARIMAIVKANAYGHGLLRTSQELLRMGVDELGVAFLEEGIALRKAGINEPILVLGGMIGNQVTHYLEYDLQITASSLFKLQQIEEVAAAAGKKAKIHIKVDTGMRRIGIREENAAKLFDAALASEHVELAGVFSHLASSHAKDKDFTHRQLERFLNVLEFFPRHGVPMPVRHIANSGAVLQHPESILDMVRPGIMLYGVYPSPEVERPMELLPTFTFKTRVVFFKVVEQGNPIGYDGTWTAPKESRVITLPVGYGDGYMRALSNKADVLLGGKRHPVAGSISMDQCMVNIGWDSAYVDDEVVLIGGQGEETITCEELAALCGTIPYEILTNINTRVPRRYV